MNAARRLIVALDVPDAAAALRMARRLRGLVRTVKVGSILFTAAGPGIIRRLRALGFDVMLDLKFFDIPSTVEWSCRAAARHRVALLTVHASGGREMLQAAMRGVASGATTARHGRPRVLAVTVLTSTPALPRMHGMASRVRQLAIDAQEAGCDGVVASAREAQDLRKVLKTRMLIACPGIRPRGTSRDDQRRVATPAQALRDGADVLIVGRPILEAADPRAAIRMMLKDMEGGR